MENILDLIIMNNKEKNNINNDILKTLKPGGYIFSFDTPNKAHNTVCDIEDIGFIVKDSISYFFEENEDVKQDVICLAMKPLSEKNFAENVMKWGTSGLNIDGTRIPTTEIITTHSNGKRSMYGGCSLFESKTHTTGQQSKGQEIGRFPANLILHKDVAPILDNQSGYNKNEGGASRFFKNVDSYKELLKYISIMGLPPKKGKVLFLGFDNADEIIKEINNENGTSYEVIGSVS